MSGNFYLGCPLFGLEMKMSFDDTLVILSLRSQLKSQNFIKKSYKFALCQLCPTSEFLSSALFYLLHALIVIIVTIVSHGDSD